MNAAFAAVGTRRRWARTWPGCCARPGYGCAEPRATGLPRPGRPARTGDARRRHRSLVPAIAATGSRTRRSSTSRPCATGSRPSRRRPGRRWSCPRWSPPGATRAGSSAQQRRSRAGAFDDHVGALAGPLRANRSRSSPVNSPPVLAEPRPVAFEASFQPLAGGASTQTSTLTYAAFAGAPSDALDDQHPRPVSRRSGRSGRAPVVPPVAARSSLDDGSPSPRPPAYRLQAGPPLVQVVPVDQLCAGRRRARRPASSCRTRPARRCRPAVPRRAQAGRRRPGRGRRGGVTRRARARGRSGPPRDLVAGQQVHLLVCSHISPAFACRNHTLSPISRRRREPGSGVCTSPAPSSWSGAGPAAHTARQPVPPAGPGRDSRRRAPSPRPPDGAAHHGQPEERRRPRLERRVVVEQPRHHSPEPAAISVTAGSAAVDCTLPVPPALKNSRSATVGPQRVGDLRAAHLQLGHGRDLSAYDDRAAAPRTASPTPATWPSYAITPTSRKPRRSRSPGQRRPPPRGRTAASACGPTCWRPHPQPGVDLDRDPDRHRVGGAHRVDHVELRHVVDHQRDLRRPRSARRPAGRARRGPRSGRRPRCRRRSPCSSSHSASARV